MVVLKNNKGISLVDIIVAIVVMVMLLTPILLHTVTTLNTSASAKEKQQVVDSATGVMEYFNQSSIDDIKLGKNVGDIFELDNPSAVKPSVCTCYITKNGVKVDEVKYNYTVFKGKDITLGRADTNYERAVVMTDLANKLLEKGYRIKYDETANSSIDGDSFSQGGVSGNFELLSDHSAVVFDRPNEVDRHAVAVECVDATDSYTDPNEVSLGNIQDLDSNKMAIIEGSQTKLDHRFESDLIKRILDYASRHTGFIDEAILEDTTNLNKSITNMIQAETNTFSRMIFISVVKKTDSSGKDYYNVQCDVSYYVEFGNSNFKIFNNSNKGEITYPEVVNRDFYTSEPPDVYFVYEPYITSFSSASTDYAYNDYICIKSDPYTSGYYQNDPSYSGKKYNASKIYLVKPTESFQADVTKNHGKQYDDTFTGVREDQAKNMYYTKSSSGYVPVNININQVFGSVTNDDGSVLSYPDSECLPLQIVTNLTSYKAGNKYYPKGWNESDSTDSNDLGSIKDSGQFSLSASVVKPDAALSGQTRKAYSETIGSAPTNEEDKKHLPLVKSDGNPADSIVTYMNDTNLNGRLYNITVTYKDPSGATTYLTGAKGAE